MAKVQIKSDKITPFGGIFPIMDKFDSMLSSTIDSTLGLRCRQFGFQYSEILRSLMCVYLCGGSCVEDVSSHLMPHLSLHPHCAHAAPTRDESSFCGLLHAYCLKSHCGVGEGVCTGHKFSPMFAAWPANAPLDKRGEWSGL